MPNSSDSCARVCEILLLFELLRRQRPDLNFERVASLLNLVGRREPDRLASPRKSRASRLINEALVFEQRIGRRRSKRPLDLLVAGLEEAPEAFPPETAVTPVREDGVARSAEDLEGGVIARHFPVGFPIRLQPKTQSRIARIIAPLKRLAADDRAQNLACGLVLPFAFKAIGSGNALLKGAGAVALLGCGIEFGVDDPQFIGPSIIEQLPEIVGGGRR